MNEHNAWAYRVDECCTASTLQSQLHDDGNTERKCLPQTTWRAARRLAQAVELAAQLAAQRPLHRRLQSWLPNWKTSSCLCTTLVRGLHSELHFSHILRRMVV
jgi:hypothetical protein